MLYVGHVLHRYIPSLAHDAHLIAEVSHCVPSPNIRIISATSVAFVNTPFIYVRKVQLLGSRVVYTSTRCLRTRAVTSVPRDLQQVLLLSAEDMRAAVASDTSILLLDSFCTAATASMHLHQILNVLKPHAALLSYMIELRCCLMR